MPRKSSISLFAFRFCSATAVALVLLAALFFCIVKAAEKENSTFAEEIPPAEKQNYEFDNSAIEYRRNNNSAGVYFTAAIDSEIKYIFVTETNTLPETPVVSDSPYIDKLTDADGQPVSAWLYLYRAEDEIYKEFYSSSVALEINTEEEIIKLPAGQSVVYDGREIIIENVTFAGKNGNESVAPLNVGEYSATLNYTNTITVPFAVTKANLTVAPAVFRRKYLDEGKPTEIDVSGGLISETDRQYIKENVSFEVPTVNAESPVGEYTVLINYAGNNGNFDVTTVNGVYYIIEPADLTGFKFEGESVLYDGKSHRLEVTYDAEVWFDVEIEYDTAAVTDIGKYRCTATITKDNYNDLILRAVLLIRSPYLESDSLTNYVYLSGSEEGFDPEIKVVLNKSAVNGLEELVTPELSDTGTHKEVILATYDIKLTLDGSATTVSGDMFSLKIKVYGLETSSGIRILTYNGKSVEEADYVFENGYFVLNTTTLNGIVFLKSFAVTENTVSNLIIAALIGAGILLIFCLIIGAVFSGGKEKKRWRRKHNKWV